MSLKRVSFGDRVFIAVNNSLAIILMMIVFFPLLFVVSASFSDPEQILMGHVWLFPKGFTLDSYVRVFKNQEIWLGYKNTLFYTMVGTFFNIFMTVLAAYPLSVKGLKGKNYIMFFITFTMLFSGGMVPNYLVLDTLGLINTRMVMILPNLINVFNMIVARTYFQNTIPEELIEASKIDGCSDFKALFQIVLPLSKPILAVLGVYYGVHHWNAFFNALMFLTDRDKFPLQIFLRSILIANQASGYTNYDDTVADQVAILEGVRYAVIIVGTLPVLMLYPFLQKYFMKGMMIGAIKG